MFPLLSSYFSVSLCTCKRCDPLLSSSSLTTPHATSYSTVFFPAKILQPNYESVFKKYEGFGSKKAMCVYNCWVSAHMMRVERCERIVYTALGINMKLISDLPRVWEVRFISKRPEVCQRDVVLTTSLSPSPPCHL